MAWWSSRTRHGQYLLVYDCGKSAAKVHRRCFYGAHTSLDVCLSQKGA
jgi:hypothetical protein